MLVAVLISACVQGPDQPLDAADDAGATGIRGTVVSDEVFPVRGANVSAEDGPWNLTDEEGQFELVGLDPGRYRIDVTAEGYEPASEDVSVAAGSVIEVMITVTALPGQAPYLETIIYDGFSACMLAAVYAALPFPPVGPCPFGEPKTGMSVEVGAEWRAGVHEMAWETQEEMIMASSLVMTCGTDGQETDPCPFLGSGDSPIRAFARINDTEYAAQHSLDGETTWPAGAHVSYLYTGYSGYLRSEINQTAYPACVVINNQFGVPAHLGCPWGVGYSTGIRFTLFHTTFYLEEPPALEAFTAVPDQ